MLSPTIESALNDQLNAELYASYLYLSMAAHFQANDLPGMAKWMQSQVQEELLHVGKFYDYINDRHGRVRLTAVKEPPTEWASSITAFEASLDHEKLITARIGKLVDLALDERDHSTNNFLQWFVGEQVEEEATVAEIVGQLKAIADAPSALYLLDRELGNRPAPVTVTTKG